MEAMRVLAWDGLSLLELCGWTCWAGQCSRSMWGTDNYPSSSNLETQVPKSLLLWEVVESGPSDFVQIAGISTVSILDANVLIWQVSVGLHSSQLVENSDIFTGHVQRSQASAWLTLWCFQHLSLGILHYWFFSIY